MNGGEAARQTVLLEREAALESIDAALRRMLAAEPSVLVLEGPPGVGKTRLLATARERAERAGVRVLSASGGEFERDFAWGVVRQLFASHATVAAVSRMSGAARLAEPVLEPHPALEPSPSFAVLHGLYWVTANLAATAPLALIVDDAHWLDEPSLRWLVFLTSRTEGLKVLVMLAARSAELSEVEPWAELAARSELVPVSPLSGAGTGELLAARYGSAPADAFVEACSHTTGGNPFLLNELLTGLLDQGVAPDAEGAKVVERLPPGVVSRGVALRLSKLRPPERAVARAAAVLGDADLRRCARLAGLDEGEAADAAAQLMAAEVLAGSDRLRFVHPLVRSAAHADLPAVLRPRWHLAAARLLDADGFDVDQVAAQLMQSERRGDAWVIERLRAAAAVAHARGAADAAARYLERALSEPPSAELRPALLIELARARAASSPAAGAVAFEEAVRAAGDARARAEAGLGLGLALTFSGRFADAADALESALADVGDRDAGLLADLEAALLNTLRWDVETRKRSRPLVERLTTRAAEGAPLDSRLHANLALERLIEGRDLEAAMRHADLALADVELAAEQNAMWIPVLVTPLAAADRLDSAEAAIDAVTAIARARGWRPMVAIAMAARAKARLWRGDIAGAVADADDALGNSADIISTVLASAFLADGLLERGETERAWEALDRRGFTGDMPQMWPFPWVQAARGRVRCARGDVAGGLADFLAYGELAERYGLLNPAVEPWRSDAALAWRRLGRQDRALELAAQELELARVWGVRRPIGIALRALGVLEGGNRGIELLRESEQTLADSPARLAHAASLADLGAALRRLGRRREAREVLRHALHAAAECGAIALAERARGELVAAGARPRRTAMRGKDALTPSELRIARLAAEGLSNPEIAQALFVTRRTVETHLTQVYRKLDIASREQLASVLT